MRMLAGLIIALMMAACDTPDGSTPGLDASWIVPDAGIPDGGSGDAGLLTLGAPCTDDSQCATALCYHFNNLAIGPRCSHSCTVPSDCEAPSSGCSGMGICKPN